MKSTEGPSILDFPKMECAMFESGKNYEFRMIRDGEERVFSGTVAAYEHPLLRLEEAVIPAISITYVGTEPPEDLDLAEVVKASYEPKTKTASFVEASAVPGEIINVTSIHFISATPK